MFNKKNQARPVFPVIPGYKPEPDANCVAVTFGENQPNVEPLPALRFRDAEGTVLTRWEIGFLDRLRVLFTGNIYCWQNTFGGALPPMFFTFEPPQTVYPECQSDEAQGL